MPDKRDLGRYTRRVKDDWVEAKARLNARSITVENELLCKSDGLDGKHIK